MGWAKYKSIGKDITTRINELIQKTGSAKLIGKDEKIVLNYQELKITKKGNYIIYGLR